VEEATGQEQEHEREGVDDAGPEVVGGALHVGRVGDEDVGPHHGAQEGQPVRHRVQDLLEDVVAAGQDVEALVGAAGA